MYMNINDEVLIPVSKKRYFGEPFFLYTMIAYYLLWRSKTAFPALLDSSWRYLSLEFRLQRIRSCYRLMKNLESENMGLLKILKDVVVITAAVAAVSTIAAPLWMLANNLDDEEI